EILDRHLYAVVDAEIDQVVAELRPEQVLGGEVRDRACPRRRVGRRRADPAAQHQIADGIREREVVVLQRRELRKLALDVEQLLEERLLDRIAIDALLDEVVVCGSRFRDLAHPAGVGRKWLQGPEQEPCLGTLPTQTKAYGAASAPRATFRCTPRTALRRNRAAGRRRRRASPDLRRFVGEPSGRCPGRRATTAETPQRGPSTSTRNREERSCIDDKRSLSSPRDSAGSRSPAPPTRGRTTAASRPSACGTPSCSSARTVPSMTRSSSTSTPTGRSF